MDEVSSLYMLSRCQGQGMLKGKKILRVQGILFV